MTEAQTSGGLLIFIDSKQAEKAIDKLHQCGDIDSTIIGKAIKRRKDNIFLKVK